MMRVHLRLSGRHHEQLKAHLFPGDGQEAASFALCGRRYGDPHVLCVHEVIPIPHARCDRSDQHVTWPSDVLPPILSRASREGLALLKIHSHPTDYRQFSRVDDVSDRAVFSSVYGWIDGDEPHASAVMLPDGSLFARTIDPDGRFSDVTLITVAGDDILAWGPNLPSLGCAPADQRQVFGPGTTERLQRMSIAVLGCSGTGSPTIEMLMRLGVGHLVLVDPDTIEDRNLNRIYGSTRADVGRPKVDALADRIRSTGLGTRVTPVRQLVHEPNALHAVSGADVVFGCMDSAEGRHLLSRLATHYLLPYIDMGVRLQADGKGGISQDGMGIHYVQPGRSSLLSRGVYTMEQVRAESLRRTNRTAYEEQRRNKYIANVDVTSPAVISLNTLAATTAVNEFLCRLHPGLRLDPNHAFAVTRLSLVNAQASHEAEPEQACAVMAKHVGRADTNPPLGLPALGGPTK